MYSYELQDPSTEPADSSPPEDIGDALPDVPDHPDPDPEPCASPSIGEAVEARGGCPSFPAPPGGPVAAVAAAAEREDPAPPPSPSAPLRLAPDLDLWAPSSSLRGGGGGGSSSAAAASRNAAACG